MSVLITHSTSLLERLVPEESQTASSLKIARSMNSRHTCLCCSNPLLRHISLGKLYWRCNHCYQAMPVIEDAREVPLFVTYERSFQSLLISIPLQEQQNCQQENCEDSTANRVATPMMMLAN